MLATQRLRAPEALFRSASDLDVGLNLKPLVLACVGIIADIVAGP